MVEKIKFWFTKHFICSTIFSSGHIPESFFYEDDFSIHTHRCSRCHSILGMGKWKGFRNCPPPNSSMEQTKQWEIYYDNSLQKIRNQFVKS